MRILLPTVDALPSKGGVARYIDAIVRTLPDVRLLVLTDVRYVALVKLFWKQRKTYDALWIHHVVPVGTVAWVMRLFGGAPYVIFLHGLDFDLARRNVWKRWLTRRILRSAQRIVTNSNALAHEVAKFARVQSPMVVYPCVDDQLIAQAQREASRNKKDGDRVRLLTVGRLVERKGHMKIIDAIKDDARCDYTIIGDGPMRATILAKIQECGISSRVRLRTDVTDGDLADAYREADVFVMPSTKSAVDREGFGIVYIEAALFGLPSIAVRQPGVDEAVIDGVTGLLIDDTDLGLKDAIGHFVTDRSQSAKLGAQGRTRVLAEFTREVQFGTLRSLL